MKNMIKTTNLLLLTVTMLYGFSATGQTKNISHLNLSDKKVAVSGYDVVSYFQGKPLKGSTSYKSVLNGVTYLFANESNFKSFESDPVKYEPQYGGWCAYAMGKTGEKVEINPKTYKILDRKLYLFYNKFLTNTLETWNEDEKDLKKNADKNWADLVR